MRKTLKKALALVTSLVMVASLFATVPFSALATGSVTYDRIVEGRTVVNYSMADVNLSANFDYEAFATRKNNNLLRKGTAVLYKSDASGNKAGVSINADAKIKSLYDGVVVAASTDEAAAQWALDAGGSGDIWYHSTGGAFDKDPDPNRVIPQGYLTATLDKRYYIDDVYLIGPSNLPQLGLHDYDIYMSETEADLYNEENRVLSYTYTGALNLNTNSKSSSSPYPAGRKPDGQEFAFSGEERLVAKYIGIKIFATAQVGNSYNYPRFHAITEFGIEGEAYDKVAVDPSVTSNAPTVNSDYETYVRLSGFKHLEYQDVGNRLQTAKMMNASKTVVKNNDIDALNDGEICWDGHQLGQTYNGAKVGKMFYAFQSLDVPDGTNPQAYFTMQLKNNTKIDKIFLINATTATSTMKKYNVYVSDNEDDLYDDSNLVLTYNSTQSAKWNNYSNVSTQTDPVPPAISGQTCTGNSEGQEFNFIGDNKPIGKFIGVKIYKISDVNSCKWFYLCEAGATGENLDKVTMDPTIGSTAPPEINSNYFTSVTLNGFTNNTFDPANNLFAKTKTLNWSLTPSGSQIFLSGASAVANLCDGKVDTDGENAPFYYTYDAGGAMPAANDVDPQSYFTLSLDDAYSISRIYLMSTYKGSDSLRKYDLFVSDNLSTLYNEENKVLACNINDSREFNKASNVSYGNAEGQDYKFSDDEGDGLPYGQYVGIKIYRGSFNNNGKFTYFSEIGIEGAKLCSYEFSEIQGADAVEIVNETSRFSLGDDYKFSVNVRNGGNATVVKVDGKVLTPDRNGIYTYENATEAVPIYVETDRDAFSPVNGIWNGLDLKKKSASYGNGMWDPYQVHETAFFYQNANLKNATGGNNRLELSLAYPIDEIVSVRSYDLKTEYFADKDFTITADGKIRLTANTSIPIYGDDPSETDDIRCGSDDGSTDWSGEGRWAQRVPQYEICVTYTHSDTWGKDALYETKPTSQGDDLSYFKTKAASGQETNVLFMGDSITVGYIATGMKQEMYPYKRDANSKDNTQEAKLGPTDVTSTKIANNTAHWGYTQADIDEWGCRPWAMQVGDALIANYGSNVKVTNRAIGSTRLELACLNKEFLYGPADPDCNPVGCPTPDMVFIAFGTNEASAGYTQTKNYLTTLIDYARSRNPQCNICIVSAFYANRVAGGGGLAYFTGLEEQERAAKDLSDEYEGIIYAPVNAMFKSLIDDDANGTHYAGAKQVFDYMSDMCNHPNDFGHKVYATTTLAVMDELEANFPVTGDVPFTVDASDEVFVTPTSTVGGYNFSITAKNGATVTAVTLNNQPIVAAEGIYTVTGNITKSDILKVTTDRDAYAPKNGIWDGNDLSKKSAAYGKSWTADSEAQFFETAFFYTGHTSTRLLYPVENIVKVQSYDLKETYYLGEDFNIVNGEFVLTNNTRIPVFTDLDNPNLPLHPSYSAFNKNWSLVMWHYQICVTYTHSDTWGNNSLYETGVQSKLSKLTHFFDKAKSGEATSIAFIGDSITAGHDASGMDTYTYNKDTFEPTDVPQRETLEKFCNFYTGYYTMQEVIDTWGSTNWVNQVTEGLKSQFNNNNITSVNRGGSGRCIDWAVTNADFLLGDANKSAYATPTPDLVVVAFGTNDMSTGGKNTVEFMDTQSRALIAAIREINPDASILFVSPFTSNKPNISILHDYEDLYEGYEYEFENLAVAPVNSVFESVRDVKDRLDFCSAAYDHPNDFGVTLYAQTLMQTLTLPKTEPVEVTLTSNIGNEEDFIVEGDVGGVFYNEAKITVTAPEVDGCEFIGFKVNGEDYGEVGESTITITLDGDTTIAAEYDDQRHVVKFIDKCHNIIHSVLVPDGETIKASDINLANNSVPVLYGFDKYIVNGEQQWDGDVTAAIFTDVTFVPLYERNDVFYTVTINYPDGTSKELHKKFDTKIQLWDGGNVTYWSMNDKPLALAGAPAIVYCTGDMVINGEAKAISESAMSILRDERGIDENGYNTFTVLSKLFNPDNKNVREYGISFITKTTYDKLSPEQKSSAVWKEIKGIKTTTTTMPKPEESQWILGTDFMGTLTKITATSPVTRYAQAYAIFEDGSSVVSTDTVFGRFNYDEDDEFQGTTVEDTIDEE